MAAALNGRNGWKKKLEIKKTTRSKMTEISEK
jgi:hypothetical protein